MTSVEGRCRLTGGMLAGWRTLELESGELRVVVLPEKGAEIAQFVHLPSGIDALFKAPWGLAPPDVPPREGAGDLAFLWNYAGGWQELFPNAGDACTYRGQAIPFHGEVALLSWEDEVLRDDGVEVVVRLGVECRQTPFRLERVLRLRAGSPTLELEETLTNPSDAPAHAVWGHHCVVGPPLVARGARLHAPARRIVTGVDLWEETARLAPGQDEPWPHARLRDGGTVDLREVPGADARSHDDLYVTGFDQGWVAVENPELDLAFRLDFDPELFGWLVCWQPYGGAEAMPLRGSYALGIEPWTTRFNLEEAVAAGDALELPPGGSLSTRVAATVGRPRDVLT